ncbi:MAG: enoyl-CoA hydratase family protein [Nocardioidaceae bacterium]|nr:enoyl-CoA hydratase family protein [Nocardioidaceae bacterium]
MRSGSELVRLDVQRHVATITLDSPHNRNALSRRLVAELTDHLHEAAGSDGVRVIVLTHSGGTFCAGADLTEAVAGGMERGTSALLALLQTVAALSKPVVAVVRGHVRAGGLGLVGACDVALASEASTFAFNESLLGLAPAIISLTTRSRLAERDVARKCLTGVTFDGVEAARSGLVTQVVPVEELDAALAALVAEFGKVSPQGLRETKALLNRPLLERMEVDGPGLVALSARLFSTEEAREGMTAFRERRPASWVEQ